MLFSENTMLDTQSDIRATISEKSQTRVRTFKVRLLICEPTLSQKVIVLWKRQFLAFSSIVQKIKDIVINKEGYVCETSTHDHSLSIFKKHSRTLTLGGPPVRQMGAHEYSNLILFLLCGR